MARILRRLVVLFCVTTGSYAAVPASPIRKRMGSSQVGADGGTFMADGLVDSTPQLSSPIRKRIASRQIAADGGIYMPDGVVDSTPDQSPSAAKPSSTIRKRIAAGNDAADGGGATMQVSPYLNHSESVSVLRSTQRSKAYEATKLQRGTFVRLDAESPSSSSQSPR